MKSVLQAVLVAASLLFATAHGNANVIEAFGTDPTSATGQFSHSLGISTSFFDDQYTFTLDHPMTLTIASVTNVFADAGDFITNFTGSVFNTGANGVIGGGDDFAVIGPVGATGCVAVPDCQGFAGSAFLAAGNYYLDISGIAGGSSGYGGNLATFAVPGPIAGAGVPGLILAFFSLIGLARRCRRTS